MSKMKDNILPDLVAAITVAVDAYLQEEQSAGNNPLDSANNDSSK